MAANKGRRADVLIERMSCKSGEPERFVMVWADSDLDGVIKKVEGVAGVYDEGSYYKAYIDARYDIEFVIEEIKAVILCRPDPNFKLEERCLQLFDRFQLR